MHELSVAHEVCRIAETNLGTDRAHRLRTVVLEVGQDSGLEAGNLEFCLEALLGQPPFGRARPRVIARPGSVLRIEALEVDDD